MSGVLNKLIAVKVLAALTVAGIGTGAAAGELPDPVQNLAADAAQVVNVDIPDADDADGPKLTKAEREAAKATRKAARDAEKAARKAAKPAEGAEDAEAGVHPDNHGKDVSECAHNPDLKGRDKGKAVSAVARREAEGCVVPAPGSTAPEGDAKAEARAARQAEKDAKKAAREQRKASKAAGATNPDL